jgi:hypothetical protein
MDGHTKTAVSSFSPSGPFPLTDRPITGTDEDLIDLNSLIVSPDPPQRGKNLTITASGTVKQVIEVIASYKALI